jgi:hypothetical protein
MRLEDEGKEKTQEDRNDPWKLAEFPERVRDPVKADDIQTNIIKQNNEETSLERLRFFEEPEKKRKGNKEERHPTWHPGRGICKSVKSAGNESEKKTDREFHSLILKE